MNSNHDLDTYTGVQLFPEPQTLAGLTITSSIDVVTVAGLTDPKDLKGLIKRGDVIWNSAANEMLVVKSVSYDKPVFTLIDAPAAPFAAIAMELSPRSELVEASVTNNGAADGLIDTGRGFKKLVQGLSRVIDKANKDNIADGHFITHFVIDATGTEFTVSYTKF